MSECRLLTEDELAVLLAQGYTLVSGPHTTEEECLAVCAATGTATSSTNTSAGTAMDSSTNNN